MALSMLTPVSGVGRSMSPIVGSGEIVLLLLPETKEFYSCLGIGNVIRGSRLKLAY
jgi:hypothetical protein